MEQQLAEIADKRKEIAEKHADLAHKLIAAPRSIALLAQLCLISASVTKDFKLQRSTKTYVHHKWFRAGLHQVVNTGFTSFDLAGKNVGRIAIYSRKITEEIMRILDLICNGTPEDIKSSLLDIMEEVISGSNNCDKLSKEVEQQFTFMINLVSELAEIFTSSRSTVESDPKKIVVAAQSEVPAQTPAVDKAVSGLADTFQDKAHIEIPVSDADLESIHQTLITGLQALAKVKEQWVELTRFFSQLAQVVEMEMKEPLDQFSKVATKSVNVKKKDAVSDWAKKNLRQQAVKVAKAGFQVNMITTIYLEVSQKHLVTPLLTLSSLLTVDPKEKSKIEKHHIDIKEKCEASQNEIGKLVEDHQKVLLDKFEKNMRETIQASAPVEQQKIVQPEARQEVNKGGVSPSG